MVTVEFPRMMLLAAGFGLPLLFVFVPGADATPEFSQKFKAKCRTCHIRNTAADLNQTGMDFKAALEKERSKASPTEGKEPEGAQQESAPRGGRPVVPSPPVVEAAGSPTARPPEKELNVYRWVGKDGSVTLTDSPHRKDGMEKKERHPRRTPKTIAARERRKPSTPPSKAPPEAWNLKGTYAQCMEQILMGQPQVDDSRKLMELLGEAEQRCAPLRGKGSRR